MNTCIVIGAGDCSVAEIAVENGDLCIAVDNGYACCRKFGIVPHLSERKVECELPLIDKKYAGSEEKMWNMLENVRENSMDIVLNFILNHMAKEKIWKCKEDVSFQFCDFSHCFFLR